MFIIKIIFMKIPKYQINRNHYNMKVRQAGTPPHKDRAIRLNNFNTSSVKFPLIQGADGSQFNKPR